MHVILRPGTRVTSEEPFKPMCYMCGAVHQCCHSSDRQRAAGLTYEHQRAAREGKLLRHLPHYAIHVHMSQYFPVSLLRESSITHVLMVPQRDSAADLARMKTTLEFCVPSATRNSPSGWVIAAWRGERRLAHVEFGNTAFLFSQPNRVVSGISLRF